MTTISEQRFRVQQTWPDRDDVFQVLNDDGDKVAHISHDNFVPPGTPKWSWHLTYHQSRNMPGFSGRCDSMNDCKAEIRARWPTFEEVLELEGHLERVRRPKHGVRTALFPGEDEYRRAVAETEALAGCLEDTYDDARLSLASLVIRRWEGDDGA
ncbi:hypothetical protein [Bosea massiliensis]|uniref:Uncharacterized protein n=1 Tax=Bosea massiliensis TaxID=151419 RepID=A0ABW0PES6_9HYPH